MRFSAGVSPHPRRCKASFPPVYAVPSVGVSRSFGAKLRRFAAKCRSIWRQIWVDLAPKLHRAQEGSSLSQAGRLCAAGAKAPNTYSQPSFALAGTTESAQRQVSGRIGAGCPHPPPSMPLEHDVDHRAYGNSTSTLKKRWPELVGHIHSTSSVRFVLPQMV